ncbi:SH2 domain-containing adapter protein F isoform X2 [Protopterus annectens]|uniref:SH2 domain-containing adapter protein F isoform X2 n=1 Tax=Protopterus annectens TaxID=7888 RepID=UPI001CFA6EC6|nr:SH2 domain-containing adapter protein F isoform X2 [Protopterus annectens]
MAKWLKEHLGFKSAKPPPPAPPKPDYRQCHLGGGSGPTLYHPPGGATGQPDILTAYKLQKERDFEDPYTGTGGSSSSGSGSSPDVRYISPKHSKHRLIKVEAAVVVAAAADKSGPSTAGAAVVGSLTGGTSPGGTVPGIGSKSPGSSPPASAEESKQEKVVIVEDYADPFDAKQTAGLQAGQEKVTENDGYMEPYEAQMMMAEIRRRGSKDHSSKPLHLYDTPYEPVENGVDSDTEKPNCPRPRESRLPEDDERPPEEYDQPWEWKKDRISKAFAVEIKVIKDLPWPPPVGQLDSSPSNSEDNVPGPPCLPQQHHHVYSQHNQYNTEDTSDGLEKKSEDDSTGSSVQYDNTEKTRLSPSKEEKVCHPHRQSSGNIKSLKHQSSEHSNAVGERIDPAVPLENQLSNQGFMHMKLSRTKESKYVLGQNSPPFDSVPEIINYYASRKLPIKGAEHMSLLYPVAIRTL